MSLLSSTRARRKSWAATSLTSVTGVVMEEIILENIAKHMKNKKMNRRIQHGFMKGKLCLNQIDLCDKIPGLVDEGTVMDVVYLHFGKTLGTVSYEVLID